MLLQINYVKTCAPFVVFPTNRIAHFVEVSLYLFYLAQQVKLDNFYDEAYIMIRMNEGTPGNIEGGELTHITGNLYLLRAKEKSVKIEIR